MKQQRITLAVLAVAALMAGVTVSPLATPRANAQIEFRLPWQQAPQEYNDTRRQGYHAGIEAARHDLDNNMPPDPRRHGDYRHPGLSDNQREDFREGFRHGYQSAYQHRGDYDRNNHDWGQPH